MRNKKGDNMRDYKYVEALLVEDGRLSMLTDVALTR